MSNKKNITKIVDQTVNGIVLTDDSELQFVADANSVWALHFDLFTSADDVVSANDRIQMAVKAPASATAIARCMVVINDGTNTVTAPIQGPLVPASQGTPGSPWSWGAPGASVNPAFAWVRIQVNVTMGADPGPIGLQFAEYTSASATGAVVYAGSSLRAQQQL